MTPGHRAGTRPPEAEFFGYAPGAFTGASSKGRLGKFDLADGGTLFLDEIGDMSPHLQAKLLRVLQEGEFYRVGGVEPVRVDVRIIAATNQPLEEKVARGEFRADLLYRLNVISFTLPPLRERPEDVEVLARRFIAELNPLLGTTVAGVSEAALEAMRRYTWPGNVRELRNVIERAMVFCESGEIGPGDLPEEIAAAVSRSGLAVRLEQEGPARTAGPPRIVEAVEAAEREAILAALRQSGGNRVRAARLLGMSRSAFYQRLRRYRLLGGPS
ncbi:sigma-54 interaction domain-containing protein [Caldinitratiruptor microaerophilus]|uniref:Sigma-54 factor interaction domain-containing protein n=1 Tax=Caldinitratiruptor microaerophilus TaxID=671077 RepID=A0AA35G709_9FIRM|nr:sigma 54-interacting transcriptional regulator [Caldinitratiruptor microaerophilus]BDG59571.1 hypothetical protein caldi_06610 [Caldinitratiruptor microaerophilus]